MRGAMSEGGRTTNNSLVSVGDLSKPANTLIEKISEAIGGVARPWQIRRVARADAAALAIQAEAEAKAELIRAKYKIEISEVERRGIERMIVEQGKNQENIDSIAEKAIPHISINAKPEVIEQDWFRYFFERGRIVSDADMQQIWANILAGEANSPGAFSKKTIDLVSTIDKYDAALFTKFCRVVWNFGELVPVVLDHGDEIYLKIGLKFSDFAHLQYLGLINFEPLGGFVRQGTPEKFVIRYYGTAVELTRPESADALPVGKALFTKAGSELAVISGSVRSEEYLSYIIDQWAHWRPRKLPLGSQ
jgi:hypothetical protein